MARRVEMRYKLIKYGKFVVGLNTFYILIACLARVLFECQFDPPILLSGSKWSIHLNLYLLN